MSTETEIQRKKRIRKTEQTTQGLWDNNKRCNISDLENQIKDLYLCVCYSSTTHITISFYPAKPRDEQRTMFFIATDNIAITY